MAVTLPPVEPDEQFPSYDYRAVLDNIEYRVVLQYDQRPDRWYLSLFDADDVLIWAGLKLVPDFPLNFRHRNARGPDGILVLIDREKSGLQCGFEDLGRRFFLTFAATDELEPIPPAPFIVEVA